MRRDRGWLLLSIFIVGLAFLSIHPSLAQEDEKERELKAKQKQLETIQKELQDKRRKLQVTKQKEAEILGRLVLINKGLQETREQLTMTQDRLSKNEKRLSQLSSQLQEEKRRLDSQSSLFERRIREVYKTGGLDMLELLLSGSNLSDFMHRTYFFEKLLGQDLQSLKEIQDNHERVKQRKNDLEATTGEVRELVGLINRKKQVFESQKEQKQQIYEFLASRQKDYEKQVAEWEQTSREIEVWIQKVIAEHQKKSGNAHAGSGRFIWPLTGRITSPFGYRRNPLFRRISFHTGIDIAVPYGSPFQAADGGEVIFSGWWDGYGKCVIVDHGHGYTTLYGHMSRIYVKESQVVDKGTTLGLVGSTGYSTGPHLHFEVRVNGKPTNPRAYLP